MSWTKCNDTEEFETIHEIDLWDGGTTFHSFCLIVGGAFGLIACAVSFYLIAGHATHYSKPTEQRHIIRILLMVPIYSLVAWLSTLFYKKEVYFDVIGNCYEAFTIAAFFSLLCHYVAPDLHTQKDYFRGIKPADWVWPLNWLQKCCGGKHGLWRTPRSGLTWFNVVWVGVFQYCVARVLMTIVAVITQHFRVYCESSLSPAFAHIWTIVVECIAVSIAMYCLIQMYVQIRGDIAEHRPFLKILSIKLVIFLSFWQSTLISLLYSRGAIKATEKIQAGDLKVGLPNLLISIEMAIFSILHLWAFSFKHYSLNSYTTTEVTDFYGNGKSSYQGGRFGLKAYLDALNPLDLFKAIGRSARWLFVGRKRRTMDPSYHIPVDAFGLDEAGRVPETHVTEYQGAGAGPMMSGGMAGRYSPDSEGDILLNHAQPNPHTSETGLTPSPYEDERAGRFYNSNRLSGTPMLDPGTHYPRPYSPYDDVNNPYLVPSDIESESHTHPHTPEPIISHQESGVITGSYPAYPHTPEPMPLHEPVPLQEQIPIPMPETYQPPPLYDDDDDHRGRR